MKTKCDLCLKQYSSFKSLYLSINEKVLVFNLCPKCFYQLKNQILECDFEIQVKNFVIKDLVKQIRALKKEKNEIFFDGYKNDK